MFGNYKYDLKNKKGVVDINIKDLESFLSIAEHGSITKAASDMYISPQGLSSLVKKMEKELDVELLERSAIGVVPNEYGKVLIEKAKSILNTYVELQNEIGNLKRLENGVIRMVSAYGVLRRLTPDFIFDFMKENPKLHLDYMEFPDNFIDEMVFEEKADIGFAVGPVDKEKFECNFLYEEEIMLLLRVDDELASREKISFKDIKDRKFVIESNMFKLNSMFINRCKKHGFEPDILFGTSGYSLCHKLCSEGRGLSLTLKNNYCDMKNTGLITIPFDEDFKWQIYIITKKGKERGNGIKKLIDFSYAWNM